MDTVEWGSIRIEMMGVSLMKKNSTTTELTRQRIKEKAILLALRNGMALLRNDLEMWGMRRDGTKVYICLGADYDSLWQDAYKSLKKKYI